MNDGGFINQIHPGFEHVTQDECWAIEENRGTINTESSDGEDQGFSGLQVRKGSNHCHWRDLGVLMTILGLRRVE